MHVKYKDLLPNQPRTYAELTKPAHVSRVTSQLRDCWPHVTRVYVRHGCTAVARTKPNTTQWERQDVVPVHQQPHLHLGPIQPARITCTIMKATLLKLAIIYIYSNQITPCVIHSWHVIKANTPLLKIATAAIGTFVITKAIPLYPWSSCVPEPWA
jgi:hypothetical protein